MRLALGMCALAVVAVAVLPDPAAASTVLGQTCKIALSIWVWLRGAVYVLAAIALAFMSFQASILGRFSMGRLGVWGGSLFALSAVPAIMAFLTNSSLGLNCPT